MKAYVIPLFTSTCVASFIVASALLGYDRLVARPAQVIGVVDVGEVYRLKEAEFTQLITKAASEDERQKALSMARQFAQRLPAALDELPTDCRCLVLNRVALAGSPPHAIDLTPLLKRKVGLP